MPIEFRSGGRKVSLDQFFDNFAKKALDAVFSQVEEKVHGAASSIVDPATGKHAEVFVRRKSAQDGWIIRTQGSPEFARELERRLGVAEGTVETVTASVEDVPHVYLAHAWEDHETLAKPLATRLLAHGIEVWLDGWEIRPGDSLRRKMEDGLKDCTHFIVLLTPHSLGKNWVETEIDVGFTRAVEGVARFIGLRVGVEVDQLSPFLRTRRCPSIDLPDEKAIAGLAADIHGVSAKPPRGEKPHYVQSMPEGLKSWSVDAVRVAEHLVRTSEKGCLFDPQTNPHKVAEATGLSEEDVRMGVLDLVDAGLVERSKTIGSEGFWPKLELFVEFDSHFMDFDTKADAVAISNWMVSRRLESTTIDDLFSQGFSDWSVRRINSALSYLQEAKLIRPMHTAGQGRWVMRMFDVTDRTRRFVRDNG